MSEQLIFRKVLSLNDTGETGAHMAGILVPRQEISFFPTLDNEQKNPRAQVSATDPEGKTWTLNFIYYNNAFFGGTRNEYRLTGLTGFYSNNRVNAGDTLVLSRPEKSALYSISIEKASEKIPAGSEQAGLSLFESDVISTDHTIRPAARIIHTVGQNLIRDVEAAIIELVKNSYDADAETVQIIFNRFTQNDESAIRITVKDDGHGMSFDTVVGTWLVPATEDKIHRRKSPKGRTLQGNKGIGRFAAFLLGDEIFLQTTYSGTKTSLILQASDFRNSDYLDQVRVIVDRQDTSDAIPNGTEFEMTSSEQSEIFHPWTKPDFEKLRRDLQRMLFPLRTRKESFNVSITYIGFGEENIPDGTESIEALPLFDYYDYRIRVEVSPGGEIKGKFYSPLLLGNSEEEIDSKAESLSGVSCGNLLVDLRVVDRETDALEGLLDRARNEGEMSEVTRGQLKRLLNEASGVSLFRGDFRIRPYGDKGNDWLELDRRRINDPSLAVGNNQVFGVVQIEEESESHLIETSSRDGLREDENYKRFQQILWKVIWELQRRRYEIRRSVGRVKKIPKIDQLFSELKTVEKTIDQVTLLLGDSDISKETSQKVAEILRADQREKESVLARIEETIGIYQGQATLGKMVGVVLHEGNHSVGIIRNGAQRIPKWIEHLSQSPSEEVRAIVKDLEAIKIAADSLGLLFSRIEPLGVRSRGEAKGINLRKSVETVTTAALAGRKINCLIEIPKDFQVTAWEQDLFTIFVNLLDNSASWFDIAKTENPEVIFRLITDDDVHRLDIIDNGPGIPKEHIRSEAIFEPQFSLKGGTGIGLPIAGEAAARNGFSLKAVHSNSGARFILDFNPPNV